MPITTNQNIIKKKRCRGGNKPSLPPFPLDKRTHKDAFQKKSYHQHIGLPLPPLFTQRLLHRWCCCNDYCSS